MHSHTCDIYTVSLHCEFCCAQQVLQTLYIVCHKHYIQTVSLQNEFAGVLLILGLFDTSFHIHCICIYCYVYSYVFSDECEM